MNQAIQRFGPNTCDACGREFTPEPKPSLNPSDVHWHCSHCGFNNKAGEEWQRERSRKDGQASSLGDPGAPTKQRSSPRQEGALNAA